MPASFENRRSLLWLAIGFVVSAALFDAPALVTWAKRLSVGPARDLALVCAEEVHSVAQRLGSVSVRDGALAAIGRDGAVPLRPSPPLEPVAPVAVVAAPAGDAPAGSTVPVAPVGTDSGGPAEAEREAPSPARATAQAESTSTLGIALVGDSMMAVGLAPYLKRTLGKRENVRLVTAFRSGTGLSRPEVFDWIAEYPKLLEGQTVSLAICAMGANDAQGFVDNGKVQAFDTPGWEAVYRQRVHDLAQLLTRDGTKVIWLSLPVMRSDSYSAKTARINQIVRDVLANMDGVRMLDANEVLADADGRFRPFIKDSKGRVVSLRQNDGIHVTDAGARLLADQLMPVLSAMAPGVLPGIN